MFGNAKAGRNADVTHLVMRQRLVVDRLLDDRDRHHVRHRLAAELAEIRREVQKLCKKFPVPQTFK